MRKIRSGQQERPTPFAWRLAAAFAIVACLVAVVQFSLVQHERSRRVAALRAESRQIAAELEAVKKIADETEPVVVLENDEGTRVIIDLDSAVQPASYRTFD